MPTYVMLFKMSQDMAKNLKNLDELTQEVGAKYQAACPDVKVLEHLVLLSGGYDFMDILEAPNEESVFKMAAVIQSSGLASAVETWTAMPFQEHLALTKEL